MKANRMVICGRNTSTLPVPAITPFTIKSFKMPGCILAATHSPSQPKPPSMASIIGAAQVYTAWNTINRMTISKTTPHTGCSTISSNFLCQAGKVISVRTTCAKMDSTSR